MTQIPEIPKIRGFNPRPLDAEPDPSTVTNEKGGKQSATEERMDLVPPFALLTVAGILKTGAEKYGEDNWRLLTLEDHLNHMLRHVYLFIAGDDSENHLGNAACRALFALDTAILDQVQDKSQSAT